MKSKVIHIEVLFDVGDYVYLLTDNEQLQRLVTGIIINPNEQIVYELSCGTATSRHYGFELSAEQNIVTKTSG